MQDPRDLLALVPHQLGFRPERSLVLVSLRGGRRRVGLVVRADLPDLTVQRRRALARRCVDGDLVEEVGAVLDRLVALVRQDGASAVVAVVYEPAPEPDPLAAVDPREAGLPGLVEALLGPACASAGVPLMDAWWVDGSRYRSLGCRDERCCPADGVPLAALDSSVVAAEMVSRGSSPLGSRAELVRDVAAAPTAACADARRGAAAERRRLLRCSQDAARAARVRGEAVAAFRRAAEVERLAAAAAAGSTSGVREERHDPVLLGRLGASLRDPWVRDAVLVSCLEGAGDLPEQMALTGPDERAEALLEGVVGAPEGAREPVHEVLDPVVAVLAAVVRHLPGADGADALGALAWSAWWCGDGARAVVCAERALQVRRACPMARLVLDLVDAGAAPAWVRARRVLDAEASRG
ncbi:DUF4192 domain-containing protein [Pseudokineococcus basanitobsidens]|uniref:DUF4192 domain-containing protein n=1 Tax=Pseudokineococcus basanitobsidens TaxID=1926649 RepID=A0ABU8RNA2_9ACTN